MTAGLGGPTRKLLVVAAQLITEVLDFKLQHHVLWVWFWAWRHASAVLWNETKFDEPGETVEMVNRTELYQWLSSLRCNSMKVLLWQWDRISISSWLPHVRVGCQPSMRLYPMVWFLEMWLDMNRTIGFSQWIWKHLSGTARSTQSLTGTWSVKKTSLLPPDVCQAQNRLRCADGNVNCRIHHARRCLGVNQVNLFLVDDRKGARRNTNPKL